MPKGKVVPQIPKKTSKRRANSEYDWDQHAAHARKVYPNALLAEEGVPITQINAVRGYRSEPYLNEAGHIAVTYRDSYVDSDGIRRANAYMAWVPKDNKEN